MHHIEPTEVDRNLAEQTLRDKMVGAGVGQGRADVVVGLTLALISPDDSEGLSESAEGSARREQRFSAWIEALDALAGSSSSVWLVEDAHWAQADTLAFLETATSTQSSSGRLVIITARPSILERGLDWEHEDGSQENRFIQLSTLKPLDAAALVESMIGPILPPPVVEAMAERSDGNPLFIEELLRTWISVGVLVPADAGWALTAELGAISLPTTVQAIYAAQIDDLPNHARKVARLGAVSGRRFPQGCFETLGATDPEAGIEVLNRRTLIHGPQHELPIGSIYTFRHALLQDAAYASLARAERARLHIRMAQWLTETAGLRAVEVSEAIANHYAEALGAASSLSAAVSDGLDREQTGGLAASWFEIAGERALRLSAHESARSLFQRSLELSSGSRLDGARRWQKLGEATAYAADMDAGAHCFEQAMDLYNEVYRDPSSSDTDSASARTGYATAAYARIRVAIDQLRFREAIGISEKALQVIGDDDDLETARLLLGRASAIYAETNDWGPLRADVERALDLARSLGDSELERISLNNMASASTTREEALPWIDQSQALAQRRGRKDQIATAIISRVAWILDDQPNECFPALARAEEIFQAHGSTELSAWVNYWRCEAAFVNGDWDRAFEWGLQAIGVGERFAYHRVVVRTWHVLLPIAAARSRFDLLEQALRWYEALWARGGNPDSPYARLMFAMANLHFDAAKLSRNHPAPEGDPTEESFTGGWWNPSLCAAIEAVLGKWQAAGELDRVRRALDSSDVGQPHDDSSALGRGTHALVRSKLLGAEGGSAEEVADETRRALRSFRVSGAPWWIGKTIRSLESVGRASEEELREATLLETALGITILDM